ncbi:FAD-binding oxidoreductase [Streptomyces antibioticus]|uniref:FAD-binding oxidoreductase n=1 Tax=Streptomyces antibioticus TaxID=1890 RepID=UPI0036DF7C4D
MCRLPPDCRSPCVRCVSTRCAERVPTRSPWSLRTPPFPDGRSTSGREVLHARRRPRRRAYSTTSVPGTGQLHLTVKRVEQGRFSAHVHQQVRVGDRLSARVPRAPSTPAPPRPSGRC